MAQKAVYSEMLREVVIESDFMPHCTREGTLIASTTRKVGMPLDVVNFPTYGHTYKIIRNGDK